MDDPKKLLITLHGIRTFGQWQERLGEHVAKLLPTAKILHYHYGYFSTFSFLVPFLRWLAVRRFRHELLSVVREHPGAEVSIVAHSFGTHLAVHALAGIEKDRRPKVRRLILAGSVLQSSFPWDRKLPTHDVQEVLNDCGVSDQVLWLSQLVVLFTGMAGRLGFWGMTGSRVMNRYHKGGHSLYFEDCGEFGFMARMWVPLIAEDAAPLPVDERKPMGPADGMVVSLLQFTQPAKMVLYTALLIGLIYVSFLVPRQRAAAEHLLNRAQVAQIMLERGNAGVSRGAAILAAVAQARTGLQGAYLESLRFVLAGFAIPEDEIPEGQLVRFDAHASNTVVVRYGERLIDLKVEGAVSGLLLPSRNEAFVLDELHILWIVSTIDPSDRWSINLDGILPGHLILPKQSPPMESGLSGFDSDRLYALDRPQILAADDGRTVLIQGWIQASYVGAVAPSVQVLDTDRRLIAQWVFSPWGSRFFDPRDGRIVAVSVECFPADREKALSLLRDGTLESVSFEVFNGVLVERPTLPSDLEGMDFTGGLADPACVGSLELDPDEFPRGVLPRVLVVSAAESRLWRYWGAVPFEEEVVNLGFYRPELWAAIDRNWPGDLITPKPPTDYSRGPFDIVSWAERTLVLYESSDGRHPMWVVIEYQWATDSLRVMEVQADRTIYGRAWALLLGDNYMGGASLSLADLSSLEVIKPEFRPDRWVVDGVLSEAESRAVVLSNKGELIIFSLDRNPVIQHRIFLPYEHSSQFPLYEWEGPMASVEGAVIVPYGDGVARVRLVNGEVEWVSGASGFGQPKYITAFAGGKMVAVGNRTGIRLLNATTGFFVNQALLAKNLEGANDRAEIAGWHEASGDTLEIEVYPLGHTEYDQPVHLYRRVVAPRGLVLNRQEIEARLGMRQTLEPKPIPLAELLRLRQIAASDLGSK
jgi:hypothetical protein